MDNYIVYSSRISSYPLENCVNYSTFLYAVLYILLSLIFFLIPFSQAQQSLSPSEQSDIRIVIDGESPIVNIINPKNTVYNNVTPLLVNYTILDIALDSIWYSINDQENVTIFAPFYISLPEGNYALKIYANDSANRINFSEVNFIINNSAPSCGNAICNIEESCSNCPTDCGQCQSQGTGSSGSSSEKASGTEPPKIPEDKINETTPLSGRNISYEEKQNISSGKTQRIKNNYQILFNLALLIIILIITIFIISYKPKIVKHRKNESRRN